MKDYEGAVIIIVRSKSITDSNMRKLVILAAMAAMMFCSCEQNLAEDEKVFTEEELGVEVEWGRSGWSEVNNEMDGSVTLVTTYPDVYNSEKTTDLTSVINPGDFIKLDMGAYVPGVSIDESLTASIILSDGSEILCTRGSKDAWSKRFFENYQQRSETEIVELDGKKLSHELIVRSFHIDKTLVELWLAGQEPLCGDWPPIELDKAEVTFPSEGGVDTITSLNYESWWINYGFEDAQNVGGEVKYVNFVYASHSGEDSQVTDILEGGWYHAIVPEKGLSNQLVITVDQNITAKPRQATIEMEAGDAFTTVMIYQP